MPFTSRVFRLLESELNKNLSFTFSIAGGLNHAGMQRSSPPRRFTFQVHVRNDSLIPMKNIRGTIIAGSAAQFKAASFRLSNLGPREQCELATIEATSNGRADDRAALDRIAEVNVVGSVDLSAFSFRDSNRPMTYVQPTVPVSPAPDRPRIARMKRPDRERIAQERSWAARIGLPRLRRAN